MKIVIVGAGAVGSYLAQRFSQERIDVVVVESDSRRASQVQSELDCLVITGNGASATTLQQAGLAEADLLVAVSSSDAVNVLACHAATKLGIPRKIARVEDPELKAEVEALGVDLVIDPGEAAARDLLELVKIGHLAERFEFANGGLVLVGAYLDQNSHAAGRSLTELRMEVEGWSWLIAAVVRRGETLIGRGATTLEAGDHVLVVGLADAMDEPYELLGLTDKPAERAVVLGATRLAAMTAGMLCERGVRTTLIDEERDRCRELAEQLPNTVVVCGDPTDPRILKEANVGPGDAVLALTGWDGENLLGCMVAKALGASEVIELEIGSKSRYTGKTLAEIDLPKSVIVGGVQRGNEVFVPKGSTRIQDRDHLIVIALHEGISVAESLSG